VPEVVLKNVSKRFGKIVAVENVNLQIYDKEYVSLLGPSGCGKTITLRLIAGLVDPSEGEIYIGGRLVNKVPPEDRGIGFVFQTFALFPHMSVWDNITYGPRVKGWNSEKTSSVANEMVEMVKLATRFDAYPRELSGGMLQRVALARALTAGGNLLLLDEPLGQLDAKIRLELRYELRRLVKDLGLTAVHVTHDQEEALTISDRIVVMRRGAIEQVGTPNELYMKPKTIFVANFIGEANFMEGTVAKSEEKEIYVEIRGGFMFRAFEMGLGKGEMIVLAVRPENTVLMRGEVNMKNCLFGSVESLTFLGSLVRYHVRLDNQDLVVAKVPISGNQFNIDDRITVYFPPENILVYKYPEGGLRRELELE